ncbi:hypothetical protein GQ600_24150 [Phytophthora cactorum]|nr:hypothetical protein GQ600_24150 [Phytophthora cactorum]
MATSFLAPSAASCPTRSPRRSTLILTLGYWATIIQKGAAMGDRPAQLICLESIAIAVVWAFYILYNVSSSCPRDSTVQASRICI